MASKKAPQAPKAPKSKLTAIVRQSRSFIEKAKPMTALAHRSIQKEFHKQEQDGCYFEYVRRYSCDAKDLPQIQALVASRTEIAKVHGTDSLEEVRKAMGLDRYREELTQAISDNISFEEGLKKVLDAVNRSKLSGLMVLSQKGKADSVGDVGKFMPDISSSEIAWMSAVQFVPGIYTDDFHGVPTILDFNMDGIEFGFDGLNSFDLRRPFTQDAYAESGITGKREDSMVVPYTSDFAKAFEQLALLIISDAIIYKNLLKENGERCIISGDGKIKRALLRDECETLGISPQDFDTKRLEDLLYDSGNNLTQKHMKDVEGRITERLKTKLVYDFGRESFLSDREIVKMIGLLSHVPEVLIDDSAFSGYVIPFGRGVKIIDDAGNIVDYVKFEPFLTLAAQEQLYYTMKDTSRDNGLLSFMFDSYAQVIESEVPLHEELPLDDVMIRLRDEYGIHIHPRSVKSIGTYDKNLFGLDVARSRGEHNLVDYTLKIGSTEGLFLLEQLGKLPKGVLPKIHSIKREFTAVRDYELFLNGFGKLGEYCAGCITLYSPEETPFKAFTDVQMQIFCDTLQHELAHGIWEGLSAEDKIAWMSMTRIGADDLSEQEKKDDFLIDIDIIRQVYVSDDEKKDVEGTDFERLLDVKIDWIQEEFCDTFSAYVNHGEEFRIAAGRSAALQAKYDYFKGIFSSRAVEDEGVEYSDAPLASMGDTNFYKGGLIKKRSLDQAVLLANQDEKTREAKATENRGRIVKSYEQMQEDEEDDCDDYDDDNDYERRQKLEDAECEHHKTNYDQGVEYCSEDCDEDYDADYGGIRELVQGLLPTDDEIGSDVISSVRCHLSDSAESAAEFLSEYYDCIDVADALEEIEAFQSGDF